MSELARFAAALRDDASGLAPWAEAADPGFAVYRNTVAKGCADAIAAQFPTLIGVVGQACA